MKPVKVKRTDIQVYRAIAIVAVVFCHIFPSSFVNGYLGVDMFFVISGFLVTQSILEKYSIQGMNKRSALIIFLRFRIQRLLPSILVVFALATPLIFIVSNPSDYRRIALQGLSGLIFLGNFGANRYQGGYFQPDLNPWLHIWSLGVEFQSYILLAIFGIFLILKKFKMMLITILVFSVSVFLVAAEDSLSLVSDYYSIIPRFWEIAVGSIAYLYRDKISRNYGRLFEFFLQIILLILTLNTVQLDRKPATVTIVIITMLLLTTKYQNIFPLRTKKIFIFVGDRAFSIYLVHLPFFYILERMPVANFFMDHSFFKLASFVPLLFLSDSLHTRVELRYLGQIDWQIWRNLNFTLILIVNVLLTCFMTLPTQFNSNINKNFQSEVWFQGQATQVFGDLNLPMSYPTKVNHNEESNETWLLVGDSHAAMFYTAVAQSAKSKGANLFVFTQYGCPYFTNSTIQATSAGAKNCIERNVKAQAWIKRELPELLITASRPGYVLDGLRISQNNLLKEEQRTLLDVDGANIIRLGPVPYVFVEEPLVKKIFNNAYDSDLAKIPEVQNLRWKTFAKSYKIAYVDLYNQMCVSKRNCAKSKQIKQAYFDDNHLRRLYAEVLLEKSTFKIYVDRMSGTRD